jgi:hypothetical protein
VEADPNKANKEEKSLKREIEDAGIAMNPRKKSKPTAANPLSCRPSSQVFKPYILTRVFAVVRDID